MKKLVILLMLAMFAVTAIGCGDVSGPCAHGVCNQKYYEEYGSGADSGSKE